MEIDPYLCIYDTLWHLFFQTVASDLAVKGAAANLEAAGGLMLVPVDFVKHPQD